MLEYIEQGVVSLEEASIIGYAMDQLDKDQHAQRNEPEVQVDRQGRVKFTSSDGEVTRFGLFNAFEIAMNNKLWSNELEDEDAELVQLVINKGFWKGKGKGSWNNFAAVGTWP